MVPQVLITDGGPHSPEDWSIMTADMLMQAFQVKPDSPRASKIEMAKERAKVAIARIMDTHHNICQNLERMHMEEGAHDRLLDFVMSPEEHTDVDQCVSDIRAAVQPVLDLCATAALVPGELNMGQGIEHLSIEKHLVNVIRQRVEMDLRTVMLIERGWEVDKQLKADPEHPHANAFKAFLNRQGHPSDWHSLISPSSPEALQIKH